MLARTFLLVAGCAAALAPAEEATPPVGAAPCIACRAPVVDEKTLFSSADWVALEGGEVLRHGESPPSSSSSSGDDASGETRAESLIKRSPEQVWAVLVDFEHWPDFMPHIRTTHVGRREGAQLWVEQRYRILLVPMSHTTIYDLAAGDGRLAWRLDDTAPHDIASSEGAWSLRAHAGGRETLVRYDARIRAGRAVPAFVERMLRERSLEALLVSLRDEVLRRYPEN